VLFQSRHDTGYFIRRQDPLIGCQASDRMMGNAQVISRNLPFCERPDCLNIGASQEVEWRCATSEKHHSACNGYGVETHPFATMKSPS